MRILLVVPPGRGGRESIVVPPLGLLYLAGSLEKAGYKVQILDAFAEGLGWTEFEERVKESKPDVFGIGGMTPVWDLTRRAVEIAHRYAGVVIAGGPHVSMKGVSILEDEPDIDYAVIGEGEITIVELIKAIESGRTVDSIAGVIGKDGVGSSSSPVRNLDELPFPARHLLKSRLYRYPLLGEGTVATIFTSRGCPYSCVFCDKTVHGSILREHSVERVLEEIELIVCGEDIHSVIIYDDLFTLNKERVINICKGVIDRGINFRLKCEARVDSVDSEMLYWLGRAGASVVAYGIETVTQHGLNFLKKGVTPLQIAHALELTRSVGIDSLGYFIVGIPGDTEEDVMENVRFARRYHLKWAQFSVLSPTPGTKLFESAEKEGWYAEFSALNPFDKDLKKAALADGYWDEERLARALKKAYRSFYLHPSYLIRRLAGLRSWRNLIQLARTGMDFIKWLIFK